MQTKISSRVYWLDALRGLAVSLMILYHTIFDLSYFGVISIDLSHPYWKTAVIVVASLFFIIIGFSLFLSNLRSTNVKAFYKKQFFRFLRITLSALLVTGVTLILFADDFIIFGVLHFIAAAILVGALLTSKPKVTAGALFLSIPAWLWVTKIQNPSPWMLPLGAAPDAYSSLDYYPLFPWIGVALAGLLMARFLHQKNLLKTGAGRRLPILEFLGRHALLIYLLHQVILFGGIGLIQFAAAKMS